MVARDLIAVALVWGMGVSVTIAGDKSFNGSNRRLIVHEWGTFTALQDGDGTALGGINVDDEPLPDFVHSESGLPPDSRSNLSTGLSSLLFSKGIPRNSLVRMRLETPVTYFYPPKDALLPLTVNVKVRFRGGWLTQFYPKAIVDIPGLNERPRGTLKLTPQTTGSLTWRNLQVGTDGEGPKTDSPVWLAPRAVSSALITADSRESEKYLFYRGVGNLDAPLRLITDREKDRLIARSQCGPILAPGDEMNLGPLWLVHVRNDGTSAYRRVEGARAAANAQTDIATIPLAFASGDFSADTLQSLKNEMRAALVNQGLFGDEAAALLQTWRQAYFNSAGLRLFFLVPRRWTDHYLPFEISQDADVTRVMVARIELVSPEQRQLLHALATSTASHAEAQEWVAAALRSSRLKDYANGKCEIADLAGSVPRDFETYLGLGRFRNALVIRDQAHSEALKRFVESYHLDRLSW